MYEIILGDFVFTVEVISFTEGCKAKVDGLPEDCYPEEPVEVEWVAATGDQELNYLLNRCSDWADEDISAQLIEQITENRDE
jgi:hypothetical protein